jgi:hypothetical protein
VIKRSSDKKSRAPEELGNYHVKFRDGSIYRWIVETKYIGGKPLSFLSRLVRVTSKRELRELNRAGRSRPEPSQPSASSQGPAIRVERALPLRYQMPATQPD